MWWRGAIWLVALLGVIAIGIYRVVTPAPQAANPGYTQAYLAHLESVTPANAIAATQDAYAFYAAHPDRLTPPSPTAVCAIKYEDVARTRYSLHDYASTAAALLDGAHPTHTGVCGTCSTLQDLAVYLRKPDLTAPVRRCGMLATIKPLAMRCLLNLGFTDQCAQTWYANARHTGQVCGSICLRSWINGEPSNNDDGGLNACLACDETQSGPVFKHEAGRTRRNSGIVSSIGRAAGEVSAIKHDY